MVLRHCIFIVLMVSVVAGELPAAATMYIDHNLISSFYNISDDTIVADSVIVDVDNINISNFISLENYGYIEGAINVGYGCAVRIKNAGEMNTTFNVAPGANIVQVINDNADVNKIGGATGHEINVENADRISWGALRDISSDAARISFTNSGLVLDEIGAGAGIERPILSLNGNITLYVNADDIISGAPLLDNIYSDGMINLDVSNANTMFLFTANVRDNALYVDIVRDTDYSKILNNNVGEFLDELRIMRPDDNLLNELDAASDMSELNDIMSRSVRLNPIKLMDAIRMFNAFEISMPIGVRKGLDFSPMFIAFDDFYIGGVTLGAAYTFENGFSVGLSGYAARMDYASDTDVYKSVLYGGNVHIGYFAPKWFARALVGMTNTEFDIGPVFDGEKLIVNPRGKSVYSMADVGINLNLSKSVTASPFIRMKFDEISMFDVADSVFGFGGGANIMIRVTGYDVSYDYGITVGADFNGQIDAALRINAISGADSAGGSLEAGMIYDDFGGFGYKLRLGGRVVF